MTSPVVTWAQGSSRLLPARTLSDAEVEQLNGWPPEVAHTTWSSTSASTSTTCAGCAPTGGSPTKLGLAVQLCGLRFLGFIPDELATGPPELVEPLAKRVGAALSALRRYADEVDGRLRRLHVTTIVGRGGWVSCGRGEWKQLGDWLTARALEHDNPSLLFSQALAHLRAKKIVRLGLDRLSRAVGGARVRANQEIHWRLTPQLTPTRCGELDCVLTTDPALGMAPLVWLGRRATSSSPESVKAEIAKLTYLRGWERIASPSRSSLSGAPAPDWRPSAGTPRPKRSVPWAPSASTRSCWRRWLEAMPGFVTKALSQHATWLRTPESLLAETGSWTYNGRTPSQELSMATTEIRRRSRRLELRTTPDERALIDRAAAAAEVDLTEFVVGNAVEAARRVLADRDRFELDEDALEAWETVNARPARYLPGLRRLMERPLPFGD